MLTASHRRSITLHLMLSCF